MEWPNPYACEKLLALLTHYDMIERKLGRRNSSQLRPIRIIKTRIRNGVHCFEIEWEKPEHYATEETHEELVITIEEESLFQAAYPELVAVYEKQKLEIKKEKKQKGTKIKPKVHSVPESEDIMNVQSHMTLKPTCGIISNQNSKLNLEISDSALPLESISVSLNNLLLPEDAPCLNPQEQLKSSLKSLTMQVKSGCKSLISESEQPNTLTCNISATADLHLSTIDWEGTSFSSSPVIPRNTVSPGLKSELETAVSESFKNISEQLSPESKLWKTHSNEVLDWTVQKTNPEERLLSGIADLHLQDLPLKERLHIKSSYLQDYVRPDADMKTLSLLRESCTASSRSNCHLSKALLGIHLPKESRNSKVLKGDQLFQENCNVNTSMPFSADNQIAETSNDRFGPPSTALGHSGKVDRPTAQKIVLKESVCLDRHSSDEESSPVFGKAKYMTEKMKPRSQKHNLAQFKNNDGNKLNSPEIPIRDAEQCVQTYKTPENKDRFPEISKASLTFLQCHKETYDTCLDSPLPLCQRLKLRFQNT